MNRIVIIGTTGSGKSTLAKQLAEKHGLKYIDLDDFHHLPGWKERSDEDFRRLVDEATRGDKWVVAGNYTTRSQAITWPRADTIIWLDMPFFANFNALFARTMRRWRTGEIICNGNKETLPKQFFTTDSILWWFLKTWYKNRKKYGGIFANPQAYPHLKMIHLCSYQQSAEFIQSLDKS